MSASMLHPPRFAPAGSEAYHYIDLGSEPPLAAGNQPTHLPARKSVSMRWMSGTILTGLTSVVLIGGALLAALNGQQIVQVPAQPGEQAIIDAAIAGQKGDRIMPVASPPATREVIPVATTVREGDRDLLRTREYALINATLASANADGIVVPPYDPITIVGQAAENQVAAEGPGPAPEVALGDINGGNAAIRTVAFPLAAEATSGPVVSDAEIEMMVRGNAAFFANGDIAPGVMAYANAADLGFSMPLATAPGDLGVRIIPENISFLSKTDQSGFSRDERIIPLSDGASLAETLTAAGMSEIDAGEIVTVMDGLIDLSALTDAHRVRLAFAPATLSATGSPAMRVSIYENDVHQATVARNDVGEFVRADAPSPLPDIAESAGRVVTGAMPRLYDALYMTAVEQGVPEAQINELIRIFAFGLDMQARISAADTLILFHRIPDGGAEGSEAILFASVTLGGVTTSFYRHQTTDGTIKYYDGEGHSADNFLLRKPMSIGELRSGYGMRLHPIIGTRVMHTGVDWAAPRGTPIVSAGDGEIVRMEYNGGGYGNYTVVRHSNGYETAYAHQSRFAEGLRVGSHVVQGQVIGYVGTTGQSTGNHLHYEVRINGQTVNPLNIRLPEGRVLNGAELVAFEEQRNRINQLVGLDENGAPIADQ